MERRSDSILICVRMDRCWNRYWRCLLLLGFLILSSALFVLLRSGNDSGPMLETNWQKHWSQTQDSAAGSKQVFRSEGNVVNVKNEFVQEYVAQEHDPEPDDGEYYDRDNQDVEQRESDYIQQYRNDEMMGKQNLAKPGSMGVVPEIHDYSLQENFRQLFKSSLEEDIKFEENYVNPCWPETIPRLPYQNNSYVKVREQSAVLEPQFQYMRQLFAKRSDLSNRWRLRCLPYFYIMETPPMATPRLYNALRFHPLIVNPDMAEPEFWNQRGPEGVASLRDYLDIFDAASEKIRSNTSSLFKDGRMSLQHKQITGDGTSSYLWAVDRWRNLVGNIGEREPKTTVPDIIKRLTPNAKIVMVLRNPTERLFLGYISQAENPSASDFHSKTGQALDSMTSCEKKRNIRACVYDSFLNKRLPVRLRIGMYYPFIQDWITVFGKDQVKVIRYEDYVSNPSEVINDVCSFLGIPPYPTKDLESMEVMIKDMEKKRKANQKLKILSATRAMLKEFHKKLNQQLANLLQDDKFLWPELEVDPDHAQEQLAPTEAQQRELDERKLQETERLAKEQQVRDQQVRDQQAKEQQGRDQQARDQQAKDQQAKEQQERDQQAKDQQARDQQAKEQQGRDQQAKDQQARDQQAKDQQAKEQQGRDQQARDQQAKEQQAKEQQARDQQAKDQQARDQQAKEQQGRDQQAKDQQARDQQAKEQQGRDQQAKNQQARDQQAKEQQARDQQAKDQQAREQQAREQQAREQQAREQQAREQQAREQQAREQQAREQQAREQQAREQQAREQQAREQQAREQQAREQQAREQQAREQQAREQQAREQQARDQQAKEKQLSEEQQRSQIQQRDQQQRQQQLDQQRAQQNQINQQVQQHQGQLTQHQLAQQNQQQGQDQRIQYQAQQIQQQQQQHQRAP